MRLLIFGILFSLFILNCKTASLPIVVDTTNQKEELSPEERRLKQEALNKANQANKNFQIRNYEKALQLANESLSIYPTGEGYFAQGIILQELGKQENARKSLESAVQMDPRSEKYLISLALLNSLLGYDKDAIQNYQQLQKISPKSWVYTYKEAVIWKKTKDYQRSLELFLSIPEKEFPHLVELYSQIGDVYLKLKNYNKSREYLEKAEQLTQSKPRFKLSSKSVQMAQYLEEGNKAMAKGNYSQAAEYYGLAISLDPTNPSPYLFRSKAYLLSKDSNKAEEDLRKAYQINDEFLPVYDSYSLFYYSKMDYQVSKDWAKKGLTLFPRSYELYNRLGLAEWKLGNFSAAKVQLRKSSELEPNAFEPQVNLAYVFMDEGRFREAEKIFQSLIQKFPDKKSDLEKALRFSSQMEKISQGDELVTKGNTKEALKFYDMAKKLGENEPEVWNAYGRAYFATQNWKQSEESFKKSLSFQRENPEAWMSLARIYALTNRKKEEQEALANLKSITKDNPDLQITIARIQEDKGDYAGAEKGYLEVRKKFPGYTPVSIRLANLYYKWAIQKNQEQNFAKALEYIQLAKKENPNMDGLKEAEEKIQQNRKFMIALPLIREANQFYDNKDYSKALQFYEKAYKETGKATIFVKVAECYMRMGQEEKGIRLLESKEKETKSTEFKEAIYSYYLSKGEQKKAEQGFQNILSQNPSSYYSLYYLGLIELERKNYDKALDYFNRSLILYENFPAAYTAKGVAYYNKGNYEKAKEEFENAYKKDDQFEIAQFNLAVLYSNQKQNKEAKAILSHLIKNFPDYTDGYLLIASLEYQDKNYKKSEEYIKQALDKKKSPQALYAYYKILKERNNSAKASEIEKELRTQYPNSPYTRMLSPGKQEMLSIQTYPKGGDWVAKPFFNSQGMVRFFGKTIVLSDTSGNTIQRIQLKEKIQYWFWDDFLVGIGENSIVFLNPETGEEILKKSLPFPIHKIHAAKLYPTNKEWSLGILTEKENKNKLEYSWIHWNQKETKEIKKFFMEPGSKVFGVLGENWENPIFLTNQGILENFETLQPWNRWIPQKSTSLSNIQQGRIEGIYQNQDTLILKIQDEFYKAILSPKGVVQVQEIPFAKGESTIIPIQKHYIMISPLLNSKNSWKVSLLDELGKTLEEKMYEGKEDSYILFSLSI